MSGLALSPKLPQCAPAAAASYVGSQAPGRAAAGAGFGAALTAPAPRSGLAPCASVPWAAVGCLRRRRPCAPCACNGGLAPCA
eukprot:10360408-Alexandrium_andersonii.AAC.1